MILEFSIANFLSFKDKVTFSMLANATNGLDDNYIISNDRRVLKTNAIYGANASGKTNLFKILTIVISMLRSSNIVNINAKLPIVPFKFDKNTINKPSEFEIKFIVDDVRYVYGFIADSNKIHEEYLYYYPNGRETKIFDRTNTNDYSFPQKDEKLLNDIAAKNAPNKFFIATATNWNYEKIKEILDADINQNNIDNLYKLIDIYKDAKEVKNMNYGNYGAYSGRGPGHGSYGNYGEYGNYGDNYGEYGRYGRRGYDMKYRGDDYTDRMSGEYHRYMESRERYGAGEESDKAFHFMAKALGEYIDFLHEEAQTPQQKQMLNETLQRSMR